MLIEHKTLYDSRVHSHNIPQHHTIHYAPPEKQAKEPCTLGGLMEILNPNHVDLDLYYSIGWSNSQTHILSISYITIY